MADNGLDIKTMAQVGKARLNALRQASSDAKARLVVAQKNVRHAKATVAACKVAVEAARHRAKLLAVRTKERIARSEQCLRGGGE